MTIRTKLPIRAQTGWVYAFLKAYYRKHGYMPTQTEIATAEPDRKRGAPIKSKAWVRDVLKELVRDGKIRMNPRKHRAIELV